MASPPDPSAPRPAKRGEGNRLRWIGTFVIAVAGVWPKPANARDAAGGGESTVAAVPGVAAADATTTPNRWQGSILLLDQSITTQTAGVGADYQSYNPTYEWWVAFKPRLTLLRRGASTVAINAWTNLYLELTSSDTTTRARELLLGPTYLWATYGHALADHGGYKTTVSLGPRFTFPTDKGARATGQLFGAGAIGAVSQVFPLRGSGARLLTGGRLGVSVTYNHVVNRWTSPQSDDLTVLREDVNGFSVPSHQLRGQMNVRDQLNIALLGNVHLARRLELALSYVILNVWRYPPPDAVVTTPPTGPVVPMSNPDPTHYGVNTWVTASLGYDVLDELTVSVGYYNLTNQLAPDGTRRNPLWSPAARFFFALTANLDAIHDRLARRRGR
jgi:hypothetical protein